MHRTILRRIERAAAGAVVGVGIVLVLAAGGCSNRAILAENAALKAENERLTRELTIQKARNEDLIRSQPGLRREEDEAFRAKGLKDPVTNIIDDLGGREELMPVKGIFGARPSFYTDVRMYVLNSRWAYASFDVGGKIGQRLYEYTVGDGGTIRWKVIGTYIVGE